MTSHLRFMKELFLDGVTINFLVVDTLLKEDANLNFMLMEQEIMSFFIIKPSYGRTSSDEIKFLLSKTNIK